MTFIEAQRKALLERTAGASPDSKPEVYVGGIGYRGAHGLESTEQSYIPFDWVNANNVAEQVQTDLGSHVFMDKETLLKLNPDVIFVDGGGLRLVVEDYRKNPDFYAALRLFPSGGSMPCCLSISTPPTSGRLWPTPGPSGKNSIQQNLPM